ncbi:hypothetical protein MTBLM1_70117 [Rhodospirillaceae bacterium LM-1]|nr:hypothetical protein MTBLM1_70117 [Rhodospirillaceae bacterium LM-1]
MSRPQGGAVFETQAQAAQEWALAEAWRMQKAKMAQA